MPRISQLPAKTTPASGDEIAIVEVATSTTKKITRADLLKGADLPNDTVTTGAIKNGAVTTDKIAAKAITAPKIDFATLISNGNFQGDTVAATYYPSGNTTTQTITFTKPFTSIPKVSVTATPRSTGGVDYGEIYTVGILTVSNSNMVISCRTNFSGNVAAQVTWTAIGNV